MHTLLIIAACGLILAFAIGLVRVVRGPTKGDRLLSLQLTGTTGIALLIVLSNFGENNALINTAFVLALLAPITTVAYLSVIKTLSATDGRGESDDT